MKNKKSRKFKFFGRNITLFGLRPSAQAVLYFCGTVFWTSYFFDEISKFGSFPAI